MNVHICMNVYIYHAINRSGVWFVDGGGKSAKSHGHCGVVWCGASFFCLSRVWEWRFGSEAGVLVVYMG